MTTQNNNVEGWEAIKLRQLVQDSDWEEIDAQGRMCWKPENFKKLVSTIIASHTASIEAKYENCPQCTGLREEYKKEVREKIQEILIRYREDDMYYEEDMKRDLLRLTL